MLMWGSAVGVGATPEAMVQTLRRIPIATDIVDRINDHCEWIKPYFASNCFFCTDIQGRGSGSTKRPTQVF